MEEGVFQYLGKGTLLDEVDAGIGIEKGSGDKVQGTVVLILTTVRKLKSCGNTHY